MKIQSFEHDFLGLGTHPSTCIVEIRYGQQASYITFIDTDTGTSVTNASEQLANEVRHLAQHSDIRFFERYIRKVGAGVGPHNMDSYSEIWYSETGGAVAYASMGVFDGGGLFGDCGVGGIDDYPTISISVSKIQIGYFCS